MLFKLMKCCVHVFAGVPNESDVLYKLMKCCVHVFAGVPNESDVLYKLNLHGQYPWHIQ